MKLFYPSKENVANFVKKVIMKKFYKQMIYIQIILKQFKHDRQEK